MTLSPWTVKQASKFNAITHRRLPAVAGALWAVRVVDAGVTLGVAIVANPPPSWQGDAVLNVARCAVLPGQRNACSMLYGACSRAARALGASDLVTYTHEDEHGASLLASGYVYAGLTDGGEWDRPNIGRHRQLAIDPERKHRWFAAWGKRGKEALAMQSAGKLGARPPSYAALAASPPVEPGTPPAPPREGGR